MVGRSWEERTMGVQITRPAATDGIRLRRAYGATGLYGTHGTYV